ncbi:zinc carboxypeptidase [Isoptericola jiangsuensis]|uniref:Zinc carboxypeptidase n=1 Tax=Isoptericola jiangsuensis TaxID=548579 RepID=A0A2A9EWB8_9MICO|nr:M14 family zinc carboxypeptidase [Isoptericola jiangsuensis]PFG43417.1 zinc carboxypeptidase [Isoptericola jiangsuensis]
MRPTRATAALALPALVLPLALATAAPAAADPVPGGPWVCGAQPISLAGLTSNDELAAELARLAARHPGIVEVEEIGRSVEGRPLEAVTVGDGPRTLLVLTQVHGDEPMGTEAVLQLLKAAAAPTPAGAALREGVTIVAVPRINPDGWERYQDRDFADGLDPRRNANDIDLNRAFGPTTVDLALAPEAVAVQDLVEATEPDLVLDYHHQVSYTTEGTDDLVTMSVLWGTHPDVAPDVADDGRRAVAVIGDSLARSGHAEVTLYPRSDTATTARNGLSLDGYPTVLVEQRGQQEVGQKGHGALVREALVSMRAVADSLADGSFDAVSPGDADLLPERGDRVRENC